MKPRKPQFVNAAAALLAATTTGIGTNYDGHTPGIFFANDSMFLASQFSEPLTTYAVGFKDPNNIEETLNFIAPPVPVGRRFEFKRMVNAEEFWSETVDDQRGFGADYKAITYSGTTGLGKTLDRGLAEVIDLDQVSGTDWEQRSVARLQRRLLRNSLRRAVAALIAASTNTAKTWGSTADPDQDVRDDLVTSRNASGIRPNRVLYGDTAANLRLKSYRVQNNAGAHASAQLSPEELARALGVDRTLVSQEVFQSTASAKAEVVGNQVLMYYADDMANTEDPSHIKRFVTMHDANLGGGRWMVSRIQPTPKRVVITVAHYEQVVIPFSTGIRRLTIS